MFSNFNLRDFSLIEISANNAGLDITSITKASVEIGFKIEFDDAPETTGIPFVEIFLGMQIKGISLDQDSGTEIFYAESRWKATYNVTEDAFEQLRSDAVRQQVIPDVTQSLYPAIRTRMTDLISQLNVGHVTLPWSLSSLEQLEQTEDQN